MTDETPDREAMVKLSLMIPKSTAMLLREVEDFLGPEAGTSAAGRWLLDLGADIYRSHVACQCEAALRTPRGDVDVLALQISTRQLVVLQQLARDLRAGLTKYGDAGEVIKVGIVEAAQVAIDNGLVAHEKHMRAGTSDAATLAAGVEEITKALEAPREEPEGIVS